MNISKELINRLSDEVITQEVLTIVNTNRAEISKIAKIEVAKILQQNNLHLKIKKIAISKSLSLEKDLEQEIKEYFSDYDFANAISDYFETDIGCKIIDDMIQRILLKGIKSK